MPKMRQTHPLHSTQWASFQLQSHSQTFKVWGGNPMKPRGIPPLTKEQFKTVQAEANREPTAKDKERYQRATQLFQNDDSGPTFSSKGLETVFIKRCGEMKQQQQTLTQPATLTLDGEEEETNQPSTLLREAEYHDSCYGKPCFKLDSQESDTGVCIKTGIYVLLELAKRQKLCDYEQPQRS
jgi:hypothetical protein